MDTKIIQQPLSELPDNLDFTRTPWPSNWGFSHDVYGNYWICFLREATPLESPYLWVEIRYNLPPAISSLMRFQFEFGRKDLRKEIRDTFERLLDL